VDKLSFSIANLSYNYNSALVGPVTPFGSIVLLAIRLAYFSFIVPLSFNGEP
jgi:hypothetical protein